MCWKDASSPPGYTWKSEYRNTADWIRCLLCKIFLSFLDNPFWNKHPEVFRQHFLDSEIHYRWCISGLWNPSNTYVKSEEQSFTSQSLDHKERMETLLAPVPGDALAIPLEIEVHLRLGETARVMSPALWQNQFCTFQPQETGHSR